MPKTPCMNCEDRQLLCHSNCERYQAFRKDWEKRKQEEQRKRDAYTQLPASVRYLLNIESRKRRNRGI